MRRADKIYREDVTHIKMECVRNESLRNLYLGASTAHIGYLKGIRAFPISGEASVIQKSGTRFNYLSVFDLLSDENIV